MGLGIAAKRGVDVGADGGGRDVFGEVGEQVEARGWADGGVRWTGVAAEFEDLRVGEVGRDGHCGNGVGQGGAYLGEVKAGTRAHDEVAGEQEVGGAAPVADAEEGVGAEDTEELVAGLELMAELGEGVNGVVGGAVGAGRIDERNFDAGLAGEGEPGHGDAVIEGRGVVMWLERLGGDGRDQDAVEREPLAGEPREGDMAAMGRVEGSAKQGDAHGATIVGHLGLGARMRYRVYVGLGSNIASAAGGPAETVRVAVHALDAVGKVTAVSSLYRTAPVGYRDQPEFINAVACVETQWTPEEMMHELLALEHSFGRDRKSSVPKGPRTLDLDLLMAFDAKGKAVEHASPLLTLPHPEMAKRRFVLEPLAEIAPEVVVSGASVDTGKTARQLAEELRQSGSPEEVVRL